MTKSKVLALLLCFILVFSGCSMAVRDVALTVDIDGPVTTLDPQFATDKNARLLITNLYEGLVVMDPEGEIHPGVATHWSVSEDGREYVFHLRDNARWHGYQQEESPAVTAHDFVFSFERLFSAQTPSPYASEYVAIKNSQKLLDGTVSPRDLGVKAKDDRTLVIELAEPDAFFLYKMAATPAMPCYQPFFENSRGRYGLDRSLVVGNGPFQLTRWISDEWLTLTPNPAYQGEAAVTINQVDLIVAPEDMEKRFLDRKTHIYSMTAQQSKKVGDTTVTLRPYEGATWAVAFNSHSELWSVPLLRQALAYATDRDSLSSALTDDYAVTTTLLPEELLYGRWALADLPPQSTLPYDGEKAKKSYSGGLVALDLERIPSATLYLPKEGPHEQFLTEIQQGWNNELGLYVSLSSVEPDAFDQLKESRDFDMMLLPFESQTDSPTGVLASFSSGHKANVTGYSSPVFDSLLADIDRQTSLEETARKTAQAQQLLLGDGIVIPLYTETYYYAVRREASTVDIFPYEGIYRFHPATTASE